MTNQQIKTSLKDAKDDLDVAYRLFRKGRVAEAKDLLAKCSEVRMSVYGGLIDVIGLMERFDVAFNELYVMFYSENQETV